MAQSDYQGMQHFRSDSPWVQEGLMKHLAAEADRELGGHEDCASYVDETSFVKKGNSSLGMQRQYGGRLGKMENCQVGVFLAQGWGDRLAAVDFQFFLPKAWVKDVKRCAKAKVPEASTPQHPLRRRGRSVTRPVAPGGRIAVEVLARENFETQALEVSVCMTAEGLLRARVWAARVWQPDGQQARKCRLDVREQTDGSRRYSLVNLSLSTHERPGSLGPPRRLPGL